MKKILLLSLICFFISTVAQASSDIQAWRNAAKTGDKATIQSYIDANLTPDVKKYLSAALVAAASKGQTEMVNFLISKGAGVNYKESGNTPLLASFHGGKYYPETVKALIAAKADVNAFYKKGRETPLMRAVKIKALDAVKELLNAGANINAQTTQGQIQTPLYIAVNNEQLEMVNFLIEKEADVNLRGDKNYTPLMRAIERQNKEIVSKLLAAKADISATDIPGEPGTYFALKLAISDKPIRLEILDILLKAGADVNQKTEQGRTALHKSVEQQYINATKKLIENGANINVQDKKDNATPLMFLCRISPHTKPNEELFTYLKDKGANLELTDKNGNTALLLAAKIRNTKIVDLLQKMGANKEHKNIDGKGLADLL